MKRVVRYLAVVFLMVNLAACAAQKMSSTNNQQPMYKYDTEKHLGEIEQSKDAKTGERVNYMLGGQNLEDCIKMRGWHACQ